MNSFIFFIKFSHIDEKNAHKSLSSRTKSNIKEQVSKQSCKKKMQHKQNFNTLDVKCVPIAP